jgi:hypothetical protein
MSKNNCVTGCEFGGQMGPKEKSYVQFLNGIEKNRNLVFAGISAIWVLKKDLSTI